MEVVGSNNYTLRVLVSRREAGAIIGRDGGNVSRIRDAFQCQAGVSKVLDGAVDRILTVSGPIDGLGGALTEIAQSVNRANVETVKQSTEKGLDPTRLITYDYFPLKALNQRPHYKDEDSYRKCLFIRLLIPNPLVGSLIGKSGARIKAIQESNEVKMVISKGFLENSNERLIDVQSEDPIGFERAISEIAGYLQSESISTSSNNHQPSFYIPCASLDSSIGNTPLRGNGTGPHNRESGKEIIKKISYPGDYIGALIGKRGSRIQDIRRISNCAIAVDTSDGEDGEREITIIGTNSSVDRAIDLLNGYYEREQRRRLNIL